MPYEQSPEIAVNPCMPSESEIDALRIANQTNNNAVAQPKRKPTAQVGAATLPSCKVIA